MRSNWTLSFNYLKKLKATERVTRSTARAAPSRTSPRSCSPGGTGRCPACAAFPPRSAAWALSGLTSRRPSPPSNTPPSRRTPSRQRTRRTGTGRWPRPSQTRTGPVILAEGSCPSFAGQNFLNCRSREGPHSPRSTCPGSSNPSRCYSYLCSPGKAEYTRTGPLFVKTARKRYQKYSTRSPYRSKTRHAVKTTLSNASWALWGDSATGRTFS